MNLVNLSILKQGVTVFTSINSTHSNDISSIVDESQIVYDRIASLQSGFASLRGPLTSVDPSTFNRVNTVEITQQPIAVYSGRFEITLSDGSTLTLHDFTLRRIP